MMRGRWERRIPPSRSVKRILGIWERSCRNVGIAFLSFFQNAALILEPSRDALISPVKKML